MLLHLIFAVTAAVAVRIALDFSSGSSKGVAPSGGGSLSLLLSLQLQPIRWTSEQEFLDDDKEEETDPLLHGETLALELALALALAHCRLWRMFQAEQLLLNGVPPRFKFLLYLHSNPPFMALLFMEKVPLCFC